MEYQPRYQAFLQMGGGTNVEFTMFISRMKKKYFECHSFSREEVIIDHEKFTNFIFMFVDEWIASGNNIKDFLNEN